MTAYCTSAPSPRETSRLPGFPAGVFSEQMVLLSEAEFSLAGGTVTAQQLSSPQGRCGTTARKSLLVGLGMGHSQGRACWQGEGPPDRKRAREAGHHPFLQ